LAGAACLLTLAIAAGTVGWKLTGTLHQVDETNVAAQIALDDVLLEARETRIMADRQLSAIRADILVETQRTRRAAIALANRHLDDLTHILTLRSQEALAILDTRLGETTGAISLTATAARGALGPAGEALQESGAAVVEVRQTIQLLNETLRPLPRTMGQMAETSDLILDCESNPHCLANRYIGIARSGEHAVGHVETLTRRAANPVAWILGGISSGLRRIWGLFF